MLEKQRFALAYGLGRNVGSSYVLHVHGAGISSLFEAFVVLETIVRSAIDSLSSSLAEDLSKGNEGNGHEPRGMRTDAKPTCIIRANNRHER
eukprot:scaffold1602_cov330-Pavlova_lutheri.AAC.4